MSDESKRTRIYLQTKLPELMPPEDYSDAEFGQMTRAIFRYYLTGDEPNFQDRSMKSIWQDVKPFIDNCNIEYEKTCARNRANGSMGGRPPKHVNNPVGFKKTQMVSDETQRKPSGSDLDSGVDIDCECEKHISEVPNVHDCANNPSVDDFHELCSLPVGSPTLPVNFKKWSEDEFTRSVDEAISGHPELSRYRKGFVRHWLHKKTPKGLPAFKGKPSWSTMAMLQEWAENPWNNAATNPATPASTVPNDPRLPDPTGKPQFWEQGGTQ